MKTILVVGGNYDMIGGKRSSIVDKLCTEFKTSNQFNGGTLEKLEKCPIEESDLTIWMPNIPNEEEKNYPRKRKGSILICSKLMRTPYNRGDAVDRIFKMNANAVIAIYTEDGSIYNLHRFELIDALGNVWCDTKDISELCAKIIELTEWTNNSIRVDSKRADENINRFCKIVRKVAEKVEAERGGRYFGNCSTRCSYLFPSSRHSGGAKVSGRNMPKDYITSKDLINVWFSASKEGVLYEGEAKPSVDTPIQLELYEWFEKINYFIHGHAHIERNIVKDITNTYFTEDVVINTENYYPCGDMREATEIKNTIKDKQTYILALNLKNHGFLLGAQTVEELDKLVDSLKFTYKQL